MGESWITDLVKAFILDSTSFRYDSIVILSIQAFEEFRKLNGFRRKFGDLLERNSAQFLKPLNIDIPDSWDWRGYFDFIHKLYIIFNYLYLHPR